MLLCGAQTGSTRGGPRKAGAGESIANRPLQNRVNEDMPSAHTIENCEICFPASARPNLHLSSQIHFRSKP